MQLDQNAPLVLQEALWQRMGHLEGVRTGPSLISLPDSRALHLDPRLARGPASALVVGTEFAHLHGPTDGSLHLTLPPPLVDDTIDKGWAELHPVARLGMIPATVVMLYGPRDEMELETIWKLVQSSYAFARGDTL
jgi:phospholipase/carboxylesterase